MTTLLIIAGAWLVIALVSAVWLGLSMRHAEQADERRLAREERLERDRQDQQRRPDADDRRSA